MDIETRVEVSRQNLASQRQVKIELQKYISYFRFHLGSIDGIIGPGTVATVQAYQRTSSIPATGKID